MGKKRSQTGNKPGNSGKQFSGKKNFKAKDNFNAKENSKKKFTKGAKQFGDSKKGGTVSQFPKFGGSPKGKKGNQSGKNKQGGKNTTASKFHDNPKGNKRNQNVNSEESAQFPKFGGNLKGKKGNQGTNKQQNTNNAQIGKKRQFEKSKIDVKSNKKTDLKTNGTVVPFQGGLAKKKDKGKPPQIAKTPSDEDEDDDSLDEGDLIEMMEAFDESDDDEDLSDFDLDESEEDEDEESDEDAPGRIVQIDEVENEEDESDDDEAVPAKKTKLDIEAAKPKQKINKTPAVAELKKKEQEIKAEKETTKAIVSPKKERSLKIGDLDKLCQEVKSRMENIHQRTIHVYPIPRTCTYSMLKEVAREMTGCRIPTKPQNRQSRGYAFLEFRTPTVAQKYKQLLEGKMMGGKFLKTSEPQGELFHFTEIENYDMKRLYVTGLARQTTRMDMKNVFPKCESIDIFVTKDGSCNGFCTVSFTSEEDALEGFENGHGTLLKDHSLCVNFLNKTRSKMQDHNETERKKKESNIERELNLIKKDKNSKKDQTDKVSEKKKADQQPQKNEKKAVETKKEQKNEQVKKTEEKKTKAISKIVEEQDDSDEWEEEEEEEEAESNKESARMKKAHESILKMLVNEDIDDDEDDDDEEYDEDDDDEDEEDDDEEDDDDEDDDDEDGEEDDDDEDKEEDDDDDEEEKVPVPKVDVTKGKKKFGKK